MEVIKTYLGEYWHIAIVAVPLIGIAFGFCRGFWLPSNRLKNELESAIKAIQDIRSRIDGNVVELDAIKSEAMKGSTLTHLWDEYAKTLHPQSADGDNGQSQIVYYKQYRATSFKVPETFFTEHPPCLALVDARLKTELITSTFLAS